jgi:hypothetical protein
MPAGPQHDDSGAAVEHVEQRPVPWTDYASFRAYVLAECLRLRAPRPTDKQLAAEYLHRRITLANLEIADWTATHRPLAKPVPLFRCTECEATGRGTLVHLVGCSFCDPAQPMPPAVVVVDEGAVR